MNSKEETGNPISNINARAIARYAMLPGILPRIRALGFHFGHFAYLLALIFSSARLIPTGHPFLSDANIGQFGVKTVLATAANNIRWSWRNTDQIAIFSAVVVGVVLTLLQVAIIALYAFIGTASANTTPVDSFFTTPEENVQTDVVLIFLEQVFGPSLNVFGAASQPLGTPVYEGLHKILSVYSMAMMVIAVVIVLYYILTVVGEAAKTGTPFGSRFNSLWAPIRLVVALGLLVPLGSGLNSAQYITLWMAKMGSGLGTYVWTEFASTYTSANDIVSKPASQSTEELVKRVFYSEVCAAAYNQIQQGSKYNVKILQDLNGTSQPADFTNPQGMIDAAKNRNMDSIILSWSNTDPGKPANDYTCGYISIELADFDFYTDSGLVNQEEGIISYYWNWAWGGRDLTKKIGQLHGIIRNEYIAQIGEISNSLKSAAKAIAEYHVSVNPTGALGDRATLDGAGIPADLQSAAETTHQAVNARIQTSYEQLTGSSYIKSGAYQDMINRGWGAASLWYGNLTKINQKYMEAINAAPPTLGTVLSAPAVQYAGQEKNLSLFSAIFGAHGSLSGKPVLELHDALGTAERDYGSFILQGVPTNSPLYQDAKHSVAHASGEGFIAAGLVWMLGGGELTNLKDDPNLDPMSRLASAGHTMLTRSILLFAAGAVGSVAESALGAASKVTGKVPGRIAKLVAEAAGALAALFFTLAALGLIAGIFLAYIIPLMPFIYFAFAVIGWVLEIFEAIIAMPLWALSHLKIDGDGMPGGSALGGYQLLLMILLRPALIVFGLIGGYVIFGAAMYFFSTLYNSATSITQQDIAGNDIGAFGIFIYTMIFVFLAYNIALMCFKMIDDVPKGMLRWMGAQASPFSDSRGDPIGGSRDVLIGAAAAGVALKSGFGQSKAGLGNSWRNFQDSKPPRPDADGTSASAGVAPALGETTLSGKGSGHLGNRLDNLNFEKPPQDNSAPQTGKRGLSAHLGDRLDDIKFKANTEPSIKGSASGKMSSEKGYNTKDQSSERDKSNKND